MLKTNIMQYVVSQLQAWAYRHCYTIGISAGSFEFEGQFISESIREEM